MYHFEDHPENREPEKFSLCHKVDSIPPQCCAHERRIPVTDMVGSDNGSSFEKISLSFNSETEKDFAC